MATGFVLGPHDTVASALRFPAADAPAHRRQGVGALEIRYERWMSFRWRAAMSREYRFPTGQPGTQRGFYSAGRPPTEQAPSGVEPDATSFKIVAADFRRLLRHGRAARAVCCGGSWGAAAWAARGGLGQLARRDRQQARPIPAGISG